MLAFLVFASLLKHYKYSQQAPYPCYQAQKNGRCTPFDVATTTFVNI